MSDTIAKPGQKFIFLLLSPRLIQRFLLTKVLKESGLLHPQNTVTTQQTGLVYRRFSVPKIVLVPKVNIFYTSTERYTAQGCKVSFCLTKLKACAVFSFWKENTRQRGTVSQVSHHYICRTHKCCNTLLGTLERNFIKNWCLMAKLWVYSSSNPVLGFQLLSLMLQGKCIKPQNTSEKRLELASLRWWNWKVYFLRSTGLRQL